MRLFRVLVNGSEYEVAIEEISSRSPTDAPAAPGKPEGEPAALPAARPARATGPPVSGGGRPVLAQMPGTILDILVAAGDQVKRGQNLLILEAMKMANEVVAPEDGIIGEIAVAKGASVNTGDLLVLLK